MTETAYPRDMVGYGRNPPDPRWPGEARVAVQFVLNYEEGGESCILHGDAASEAFLSEITGAAPLEGVRHMNMESIYEYGSRAGFWRLWRMFGERGLPVTVYGVALALRRNPQAVAAMREAERFRRLIDDAVSPYDLILAPCTDGAAPVGIASTGNARFQGFWTILRLPAVTLPTHTAQNGLPVGIQLVGHRFADSALLGSARWVFQALMPSSRDR